jgi:hypothetical protein
VHCAIFWGVRSTPVLWRDEKLLKDDFFWLASQGSGGVVCARLARGVLIAAAFPKCVVMAWLRT